ncbi:hypothetical protein [Microvirga sp. TS319]|uniref:hypothetical protein n=1 Tax=Microvirga sp. TS319 TaxID=3241165 RepID=UPI003519E6EE
MPNPFDQFDAPAQAPAAPVSGGNPFDQFDGVPASVSAVAAPWPSQPEDKSYTGKILPFSVDANGEKHLDFDAGITGSLMRAITTPRDVYEGKIDLNTPEGQDRAIETAMMGVTGHPSGISRLAPSTGASAIEVAPKVATSPTSKFINPEVVAAAKNLDIDVPVGIATDSRVVQAATQVARQVPIGGSIIEKSSDNFLGGLRGAVDEAAASAGGGNAGNKTTAGSNLRTAVEKAVERNRSARAESYEVLRGVIDAGKPVSVTEDLAGSLNSIMQSRVAAGEGTLPKDLAPLAELATNPNGATFNGLQRARTTLAERIDFEESQGFNAGDLKAAYGAVTRAMESAVQQSALKDPASALKRFQAADAELGRLAETNKGLRQVLRSQSDEALADKVIGMAAQGGRANIRQLQLLQQELGDEAFNDLSSVMIGRMGYGPSGGEFSFAHLVSNWNKLSPEGKAYLFRDQGIRKRLDDIMTLARPAKEAEGKFVNKSNTGRVVVTGGLALGTMGEFFTGLGAAIGGVAFGKLLSTPVTSPLFHRWTRLASEMKVNPTPQKAAALETLSGRLAEAAERAGIDLPADALH